MNIKRHRFVITVTAIIILNSPIYSQDISNDYIALYESEKYSECLKIINTALLEFYQKRVEDKKIPDDMVSLTNIGQKVDLVKLFRNRKEKGFFIEDNHSIQQLHIYYARCLARLNRKREALSHYIQALRFSRFEQEKDDIIFYEISQVFLSMQEPLYFRGYIDSLEQAYSFNNNNYKYSLELGLALFSTEEKKKAAFHLERYVSGADRVDPEVYLKLASLYESIKNYLKAEKYYNEYLKENSSNGEIHFSLGYLCYKHTGNFVLAESSFKAALKFTKEDDIYRKAKSHEYLGDIYFSNMNLQASLDHYNQCLIAENKLSEDLKLKQEELKNITLQVNNLKKDILYKQDFQNYEEYEMLLDKKGKVETEINDLNYKIKSLNPGKLRWNMAEIYNKTGDLQRAIELYRQCIFYNYNASTARDMITKLQLKIKRGF